MTKPITYFAMLAVLSSTALGQAPAVPPAAAPLAPNNVTVSNKCCSIWDFLGVAQVGGFVSNQVCKTQLFTGVNTLLSPVARALGLGPSLLSDKFAKEGGVMGLANQLKKEQMKAKLKVQAIKYLAKLDCQCYPEIVDELLNSLEDCSEEVRYAAVKALRNDCGKKHDCILHCKKTNNCATCNPCSGNNCPECECSGCACQKKVIDKLNAHLLARDEFGCLKEKSDRIRRLMTEIIEECLVKHQPHPGVMEPPADSDEQKIKPDPDPIKSDEGNSTAARTVQPVPRAAMPMPAPHVVGYRGETVQPVVVGSDAKIVAPVASPETVLGSRVISTKVISTEEIPAEQTAPARARGKRHLFGEIFGY